MTDDAEAEVSRWEQAVAEEPADARRLFELGNAFARAGRYHEAARAFAGVIEMRPDVGVAYFNLANAHLELQDWIPASVALEQCIALEPSAEAYGNLGLAFANAGRSEEALSALRSALDLNPQSVSTWVNLVRLHSQAGRQSEALESLNAAAQHFSVSAELLAERAKLFEAEGRAHEAIEVYEQVLTLAPGQTECRVRQCALLHLVGRNSEVLPTLDRGLAVRPDDPILLQFRAALAQLPG